MIDSVRHHPAMLPEGHAQAYATARSTRTR